MIKRCLLAAALSLLFPRPNATADELKTLYRCEEKLDEKRQEVMDTMLAEFERSKSSLRIEKYDAPYFMSYHIKVVEEKEVVGKYGSARKDHDEWMNIKGDVRVGSYKDGGLGYDTSAFHLSEPYLLQRKLWMGSDKAIKKAYKGFHIKKAKAIDQIEDEKMKNVASFSKEEAKVCFGNDTKLDFDEEKLEGIVQRVSSQFNDKEDIIDSFITISGRKVTDYFINTEGAMVVQTATFYHAKMYARLISKEGEHLSSFRVLYYRTAEEHPSEGRLTAMADELLEELRALRDAPVLGPAAVPAILDSENTGVFWHEVMGHRLEGERVVGIMPEGTNGEPYGILAADNLQGSTFKDKIGQEITSGLVTLVDDPNLARFKGSTLNGHYMYDDEGVIGQRVVLIEKGVLKNYLMSRKPIPGFANSNGHGRTEGQEDAIARMGNTMLIPEKTISLDRLKQLAGEEAIKQGKDFYLIFRRSSGGITLTDGSSDFQTYKVMPVLTYKVDVKTGKETLVRPVEQIGTPLNMLNEILAFGNDSEVWNGYCGAESGSVPVSVAAPSMLLKRVEVQNKSFITKSKPPILPPPKP